MTSRQGLFVAPEGIPFLLALAVLTGFTWRWWGEPAAGAPLVAFIYAFLVFRDPWRAVSAAPLGVVSPVDGKIVETIRSKDGLLDGEVNRITIRVSTFGTYTARAPVEGKIMDLHALARPSSSRIPAGLWVMTDEGENVVLQFGGNRFGIPPRALLRYGERVGQGQRCAYLRLTKYAEVELPGNARILVEKGQRVSSGADLLAQLPPP